MIALTGLDVVLRGFGFLYWVVAGIILYFVMTKSSTRKGKIVGSIIVVCSFGSPVAISFVNHYKVTSSTNEAVAYWRKLCDEKSGEKIYRRVTSVRSVAVIKPLSEPTPGADYDQFWYGDPYSAPPHSRRGEITALRLAFNDAPIAEGQRGKGFEFVEVRAESGDGFYKYYYPKGAVTHQSGFSERPASRFGISWEDISTPEDRKYWVAGSRLRVIDLTDSSVVAERIGYLIDPQQGSRSGGRQIWANAHFYGERTGCPAVHDYSDRWFLLKVLKWPSGETQEIRLPALASRNLVNEGGYVLNAAVILANEKVVAEINPKGDHYPPGVDVDQAQPHANDIVVSIRQDDGKTFKIVQGINPKTRDIAVFQEGRDTIVVFVDAIPYGEDRPLIIVRRFDETGKMTENLLARQPAEVLSGELLSIGEAKVVSLHGAYLISVGRMSRLRASLRFSTAQLRVTKAK